MAIERQELWCHDCRHYVQFDLDTALNGNHVLECPNCGHEHCRVVCDGEITDIRWDQRNGPTIMVTGSTTTTTTSSTWTTCATSGTAATGPFLYGAWLNVRGS